MRIRTKNKYGNEPCSVNGEKYRSRKEMRRHQELILLEKAGLIKDLKREVSFELAPGVVVRDRKRPPLRYYADFVYVNALPGGAKIIEDCKGKRTEGYRIKRHLMKSIHGIDILET